MSSKEKKPLRRRNCPICEERLSNKKMKYTKIEEDRFILAALIPDQFASNECISQFLRKKAHVCFDHYLEASTRIEEHIRDPKAVEKMLMPIQSVNPNLTTTGKGCILTQFLFRNKKRRVSNTEDAVNKKCSICNNLRPTKTVSEFSSKNSKTVIMVGCILRRKFTLEHDQFQKKSVLVCHEDIKKIIKEILNYLEVQNPIEISDCSTDLMEKLMKTANSLLPEMTDAQFKKSVREIAGKNESLPQHAETTARITLRCSVCKSSESRKDMCQLSSINVKTSIMAACVLRETHTLEEARQWVQRGKREPVCHKHFHEVNLLICERLGIRNARKIENCSEKLMDNFMETVKAILPSTSISRFKDAVCDIAWKAENFEKQEIQAPEVTEAATEAVEEGESATCGVCQLIHPKDKFIDVKSKKSKALIIIGCIIRESHTLLEDIKLLSTETEELNSQEHFQSSVKTILDFLGHQNDFEETICSRELMEELRSENALPNISKLDFELTVLKLSKKIEEFLRKGKMQAETSCCDICELQHPAHKFLAVKSSKSKALIMLGCIIRESHTLPEAREFVSSKKEKHSCRRHFRSARKKILDFLGVQKPSEISSCSDELVQLMITVNGILPKMTIPKFKSAVLRMAKKIDEFESERTVNNMLKRIYTREHSTSIPL